MNMQTLERLSGLLAPSLPAGFVMERAADQLAVRDPNGRIVTCFSVSSRKEEEFATQT